MLNDLYSLMDSIISNFDCYKVETIGDAYMVVSGLPIRNSNHASQIASLALMILNRASKLEIRHRPGELFQVRIGIHSGQVVAGCVGLKMPRYCLFGDTVNCASRMESTSEPRRIHISLATYTLIKKAARYVCEERGLTFIKGKGEMRTFWLQSEEQGDKIPEAMKSDEWNKTPDLLQLNDKNYASKSLDNLSSSLLFSPIADHNFFDNLPSLDASKNFPSHDCYLCQKKKYLHQKYHQELRHRCDRFHKQLNFASSSSSFSSDSGSLKNACACITKTHSTAPPQRSQSLVPQSLFKE